MINRNFKNISKIGMTERINEKLLANTPKGGKLGGDGILRYNGKEYVARSMDIAGDKVIYQQLGKNNKPVEVYKITNDKGYLVTVGKPKISASQSSPSTLIKDVTKDIKFYDSSKTPGIVAGATIGGGIDIGSQYINNGYSFKNIDHTEVVINALGGAYGRATSGLFSAIGRGAFVDSSTELYSQLKDRSKDVDKDRVFNKLFLGGAFGTFGNIAGNFGKNIKVGDGDLQTELKV
ncbi:hypothetical protein [Campylobacter concisus]|uniref:hypothetical protein n=1 Tax=Campylobacter concisus TaxID=199 RepID=UPI00122C5D83|nr:hypothetical protein [Campylobacter concisus]